MKQISLAYSYPRRLNQTQGFTLIEILLALFIFAIIALITTATLHSVIATNERLNQHYDRLQELQFTSMVMENDISQITNRSIITNTGNVAPALIGEYTKVEFTRAGLVNPFQDQQQSNMQRVAYYVNNQQLIRATWSHLDQLPADKPNEKILLTHVAQIEFGYLGNSNGFAQSWLLSDNMKAFMTMPRAIQVKITLRDLGQFTLLIPLPNATNLQVSLG
jgi:general secretion pathway protein J